MSNFSNIHGGSDNLGIPRYDFSSNANCIKLDKSILKKIKNADIYNYPDPNYTKLRGKLARYHSVNPAQIIIGASASELINRITFAYYLACVENEINPIVQIPKQSYGDYKKAALGLNIAIENRTKDFESKLTWFCEPSSPLGKKDKFLKLINFANYYKGINVLDLAYYPLILRGKKTYINSKSSIWQMITPNKALGLTGIRASYIIAPQIVLAENISTGFLIREVFKKMQLLAPSWAIGGQGAAMLDIWTDNKTQDWLKNSLKKLRKYKKSQIKGLKKLGWKILDSDTNFFTAKKPNWYINNPLNEARIKMYLRDKGIKLRDTESFNMPNYARIAVLPRGAQKILFKEIKYCEQNFKRDF